MFKDQQGNALSGANANTADLFDQALASFNIYRGDPVRLLGEAVKETPDMIMAHVLKAWLFALATEPGATSIAQSIVAGAKELKCDEREASHIVALELLLQGNWTAAALQLDQHNIRHPLDLTALQIGHLIDFYRASARGLRDRIARALPKWSSDIPGYSVVLGMYSFGLEESGDYTRAEECGRQALDLQPLDSWAHHAVAHVMEMQGRAEDGIGWMKAREPHWTGDDNFFQVHNWWHNALYHLDLERVDEVIALYDGPIWGSGRALALDNLDASALLWRIHLAGHDVGNRWNDVATAWDAHADGQLYPFNDWHAAMAYLGAGRESEVDRILAAYRNQASPETETADWARKFGLPLIEGFGAFWHGDYQTATEKLHGARMITNHFGGSHAQRDVIDWTLTEAAIRGGLKDVAEALANERLQLKPHSPVNRGFLKRANAVAA